ncbi:hypothetical protein Acid345_0677 [Candidatus Koribacter versatilis Ellin345]|uniref:DUF5666 domain-containing protein n=1 Tax=Koribacter versatilis (strain Ellin345) TaxID=204669 RepID=Q1ITW8_KORVE|nr:hypothetical protein [Candidatus Koribacter versatilis]ABF39682.1 hypothetical protein Acid345_0677 [Candidatus Koribacter versatilis Ellin345]
MKQVQKIALLMITMFLAIAAFAGTDKSSVDLTLNHKAVVNGTTLEPGDYKVVLERQGDTVQATFRSGRKTVATSSGHFEQRAAFPADVAVVVGESDRSMQQLLVKKMNGAVVFDNGGASAAGH